MPSEAYFCRTRSPRNSNKQGASASQPSSYSSCTYRPPPPPPPSLSLLQVSHHAYGKITTRMGPPENILLNKQKIQRRGGVRADRSNYACFHKIRLSLLSNLCWDLTYPTRQSTGNVGMKNDTSSPPPPPPQKKKEQKKGYQNDGQY